MDEPLFSVPVDLDQQGDGDEFHTQNSSNTDWERKPVIMRPDNAVRIFCELLEVRHGTLGAAADKEYATIVVLRLRFSPRKNGQRVKSATLKLECFPASPTSSAPEVEAIAPDEDWGCWPTADEDTIVRSVSGDLGASGVPMVNAGVSAKLEKTTTRKDVAGSTKISGFTQLGTGRNSGSYTIAQWSMRENELRQTGVPASLTVAVRLAREHDGPFNIVVDIETHPDAKSAMSDWFKKVPLDDPILFNPKATQAKKGRSTGVENLGEVDLETLIAAKMAPEAFWAAK